MGNIPNFQAGQRYPASWRLSVCCGVLREIEAFLQAWGCLKPKLLLIFTGSINFVGPPEHPKVPPMPRGAGGHWSECPVGSGAVPAVAEGRLAPRSTAPACSALTTALQFILSYFPRTSGKQTMHHFKDAFMKQLGCIKLFLL